jgi:hypothetical protein
LNACTRPFAGSDKSRAAAAVQKLRNVWVRGCKSVKDISRSLLPRLATSLNVKCLAELSGAHLAELLAKFALDGIRLCDVEIVLSTRGA